MPFLAGETLIKRYRIVHLLGQGQLGAVYRAWDTVDRRDVAVKEHLDPSLATQRRFREQARQLSRLEHANRPKILDHFAIDGVGQYLVSEYIDGVDLQTLVDQYGTLPSDRIIEWLQAACVPLADLHSHGQLHLNIKPANIRLTPDGRVFLVDSGLPALGIPVGNSGYVAPEQQKQAAVTVHSDIYALGATLYTLLTAGVPPDAVRRESGLSVLKNARDVNPDIEPYLSIVANRALSLPPDARYDSAEAFAVALNRPSGRPAPVGDLRRTPDPLRTVPLPHVPQPRRRQMERRTIAALSIILLAVIAVGVWLGTVNRDLPVGVTQADATATVRSQVALALTELAPTPTFTPDPTLVPTPTPAPLVDPKSGARMLFLPAAAFRMGNDDGEADEKPSHLVRLDSFYIDETEVTNAQYAACVDAGACTPPQRSGATFHASYYGDPAFANYPVIFVNWEQAGTFCTWRGARLPSEAEWEFAAAYDPAVAQKLPYPWGLQFDGALLNYCDANCTAEDRDARTDDGHRDTAPVTAYPDGRSPQGAYNMAGNVWEWVSDWYNPDYYGQSTDVNPFGPSTGEARVIRGGSWLSTAEESTTTFRGRFVPEVARANLGFRCAMASR